MKRHFADSQTVIVSESDSEGDENENLEQIPIKTDSKLSINVRTVTNSPSSTVTSLLTAKTHSTNDADTEDNKLISSYEKESDSEEESSEEEESEASDSDSDDGPALKPIFIKKKQIKKSTSNELQKHEKDLHRMSQIYSRAAEKVKIANINCSNLIDDTDGLDPKQEKLDFIKRCFRRLYNIQIRREREELERSSGKKIEYQIRSSLVNSMIKKFKKTYVKFETQDIKLQEISQEIYNEFSISANSEPIDLRKRKQMNDEVEKYDKSLLPQKFQKTNDIKIDRAVISENKNDDGIKLDHQDSE